MGGATLTIDVGAVVANWRALARRHAGQTAAVVKADAYGLGAAAIVPPLASAGCATFFVATVEEGLAVRALVADPLVAVLNGCAPDEEARFVAGRLTPVLNSLSEVARWQRAGRQAGRPLPALLHVDTGMSRLGLDRAEFATLRAEPGRLDGIDLLYIMSHLISAEDPDAPETDLQASRFAAVAAAFPGVRTSLANSAGLFLGPGYASDLARPGIALYGGNPTPGRPNPMAGVVSLAAPILQVREIAAGDSVGYNASWRTPRPARIATIGVGYADGLPRSLGNRMTAWLDGRRIPLVGRVSMDLMTFDITDHPETLPGATITLIGPEQGIDEVAQAAGTIGYEILTSLGRRYRRVVKSV